MNDRFDFDDFHDPQLFEKLRENRREWYFGDCHDCDLVLCVLYEYYRERQDLKDAVLEWRRKGSARDAFDFETLHPGQRDIIIELAIQFPEWPQHPYLLTDEQHIINFLQSGESRRKPLMVTVAVDWWLDDEALLQQHRRWLKVNRPKEQVRKKTRGSGSSRRLARNRLRWLGNLRLWELIKKETSAASNLTRFHLYSDFLQMQDIDPYDSPLQLDKACDKARKEIRYLLGTPSYLQPTTN